MKMYNEVVTAFVEGYKETVALYENNPGLDPGQDLFSSTDDSNATQGEGVNAKQRASTDVEKTDSSA